ncbi:hypothetical protein P280DRAFT_430296 [Massarina eburnea CBS 473.64]|uniref:Concanavalin A-like lectin/glucanase n=1 Tax=Massarina eburnea CBS 473.64 TaxID=1395130 RepID=A0A6A6RV06_9PLEO|nr:hypothetical protein P280DRAFT_430296 [Massarina eburnea CBS 473.64]
MVSSLQLLTTAAGLVASAQAAMGPAFSTGPVGSGSWIREATSTLILPAVPSNNKGDASLWVGMGTSNGDLIQSIAENYDSDTWNVFAYTLLSTGPSTQMPVQAEGSTAKAGDKITMHYVFSDSTGNYTQYVLLNGNQVSTLSTEDGQAQGFGSAVECAATDCGSMPAHQWIDTKITLDTADPNYSQTLGKGDGVTGDMSTSDGGKTWSVTTINIPAFTFA